MSLSSVCHAFHHDAKLIHSNLKRSHAYELFASAFGFASYAALNQTGLILKCNIQSVEDKSLFVQRCHECQFEQTEVLWELLQNLLLTHQLVAMSEKQLLECVQLALCETNPLQSVAYRMLLESAQAFPAEARFDYLLAQFYEIANWQFRNKHCEAWDCYESARDFPYSHQNNPKLVQKYQELINAELKQAFDEHWEAIGLVETMERHYIQHMESAANKGFLAAQQAILDRQEWFDEEISVVQISKIKMLMAKQGDEQAIEDIFWDYRDDEKSAEVYDLWVLFYLQQLQGYRIRAMESSVTAIMPYPGSDWVDGVIETEALELPLLTKEALSKAKDEATELLKAMNQQSETPTSELVRFFYDYSDENFVSSYADDGFEDDEFDEDDDY